MTIVETRPITGGVDTHLDVHVAAALDANGGVLGVESFPTTPAGFADLHAWLSSFGALCRVGVERTGAYGVGLARFLRGAGVAVFEVSRPNRRARRQHGKSDSIDAIEAARAALSGRAHGTAKTADGNVEAIRVLLVGFRSGRDARIKCLDQLPHLGFCAPDDLRERFGDVSVDRLARTAVALRPNRDGDPVVDATKLAMQTLGRRVLDIDADCARLGGELTGLVRAAAPSLVALHGVGTHTAAMLLVAAGDNAERITSQAAFAHLCGAAPIPASSAKTVRHRLNRGGNRQANPALWRIVFTRMCSDPRTRAYVERCTIEGRVASDSRRQTTLVVTGTVGVMLPSTMSSADRHGSAIRRRTNMGDNAAIVTRAYEAFGTLDIPTVLGLLAEDVSWTVPTTVPQGGTFAGRDGVGQFFQGLGAAWSSLQLEVEALGELGDGLVVGIVRGYGVLADGTADGYGAVHVFAVRDGQISSFREFTDVDASAS